ncbi:hypothetical protein ABPG75_004236 [Micractinium tetrahymenae]
MSSGMPEAEGKVGSEMCVALHCRLKLNLSWQQEEELAGQGYSLSSNDLLTPFSQPWQQHLSQRQWQAATARPSIQDFENAVREGMPAERWAACVAAENQAAKRMRRVKWRLSQFQTSEGQWRGTEEQFWAELRPQLLPDYRAGGMGYPGHRAALHVLLDPLKGTGNVDEVRWEEAGLRMPGKGHRVARQKLASSFSPARRLFSQVLSIADNGVRLHFLADPCSKEQQQRPGYQRKKAAVQAMLAGLGQPVSLLEGPGPPSIWLGNLQSAEHEAEFVDQQVSEELRQGILLPWKQEWGPPHTISPMGVAVHSKTHKKRKVTAPLTLNWWERYQQFHMERRADAERLVEAGDFLWNWDAKKGYMWIRVHPDCWKYLCVCWRGKVGNAGEGQLACRRATCLHNPLQ